jgi:hypothetical protein
MRINQRSIIASCFIFWLCIITGCVFTSNSVKDPVFAIDTKILQANINSLVTSQEVNLNGVESKTGDKTSSTLVVKVINAQNVPLDDQLKDLGKKIAIQIKQALKDPKEYDTYQVYFVAVQTNGSVTNTKSTGSSYSSNELVPITSP